MSIESIFKGSEVKETKPIELIDETEISNFEVSRLVSTEAVTDYIRETIPVSHLENCPSIRYEPIPNEINPYARGTFERETHEIRMWGDCPAGADEMITAVIHEIGHNVHENLIGDHPELAAEWEKLHQASFDTYEQNGLGFVKEYSRANEYEDVADPYRTYIGDPEKLQFYNPDKYEFMKENIFDGQEYPPRSLGGYYLTGERTYSWSLYDENGEPKILPYCPSHYGGGSCAYAPNGCTP